MTRATYAGDPHSHDALSTRILLTNGRGDFLSLGCPNASNYDGLFVQTPAGYEKLLWNVLPEGELRSIAVGGRTVTRSFADGEQRLTLTGDGARFDTTTALLTLDCKRLHDESDAGRHYDLAVGKEEDVTLVKVFYEKQGAYTIAACIATTMEVELLQTWRNVAYPYDDRRGTQSTRWVFDALRVAGRGIVAVAHGSDAEEKAKRLVRTPLHDEQDEHPALRALSCLRTENGIFAGLPWFHQQWSRDELVALGGILAAGEPAAAIAVIDKWYAAVRENGTLPAIYPDEGLTSVDAPGWLGRRTLDVLPHCKDTAMLERWHSSAERLLNGFTLRDGLVWSGPNETWMDTSSGDDGRAGARVEIQALFLALCDAHAALSAKLHRQSTFSDMARSVVESVHGKLVVDGTLIDGLSEDGSPDMTTRPNIFLAWYAAPRLFAKQEWAAFFGRALSGLWLPWGGLASIAKDSPQFHDRDTGEDAAAYHRGDSWYFVNNIAALALHATDPRFGGEVRAIRDASVRDLTQQGYLGHASELSSAAEQEAMGCHAQAWSASTLVELLVALGEIK